MFSLHNNKDQLYSKVFCWFLQQGLEYEIGLDAIIARQVPVDVLQQLTPQVKVDYFKACLFETSDGTDLFQQEGAKVTVKLWTNTLYYWKSASPTTC